MTWRELQAEIKERYQSSPHRGEIEHECIVCAISFLGSIAQNELDRRRNRVNFTDKPSIGMLALEMLDYCNEHGLDAEMGRGFWPHAALADTHRDKLLLLTQEIGSLACFTVWAGDPGCTTIGGILFHLDAYCYERNLCLLEIATETWRQLSEMLDAA